MKFFKTKLFLQKTSVAIALLGMMIASFPPTARSQSPSERIDTLEPIVFAAPDLSGRGRPGDRRGGASRGQCPKRGRSRDLVAFIPDTETNPSVGLTAAAHPTFWFHVPYSARDFSILEFTLLDEAENTVYQTQLTEIANLPGIVSFRLPETVAPLTPEKTYRWYVEARCETKQLQSDNPSRASIGASIIRIPPSADLEGELKNASTARERALVYSRRGLWYDTLTEIGTLLREGQAREDWERLLESLDLGDFANRPLVDCCKARSEQ